MASSDQAAETLRKELESLDETNRKRREQLEAGRWRQQRSAAAVAETDYQIWGFWRQAAVMAGTLSLAAGLFVVAAVTEGPERWLSIGLLGAVVYAVLAGGPPA